ncbi:hypothetical protein GCM10007242_25320 [Pigmentiphaga litoralis]|nr:hypothetical protein GCM10007242_25320 [Pigmentiphaga litoralis]
MRGRCTGVAQVRFKFERFDARVEIRLRKPPQLGHLAGIEHVPHHHQPFLAKGGYLIFKRLGTHGLYFGIRGRTD